MKNILRVIEKQFCETAKSKRMYEPSASKNIRLVLIQFRISFRGVQFYDMVELKCGWMCEFHRKLINSRL